MVGSQKGVLMLEGLKRPDIIRPCKVRSILDSLNDRDQEILMEALLDPEWKSHTLAVEMTKLGLTVSANSVHKHRQRSCSCRLID